MIRIAIVDDAAGDVILLQNYLKRFFRAEGQEYATVSYSSSERLLWNYESQFDLIFLDIEMDGMTGMQAAEQIRKTDHKTILVFVTQMAQYAVQGYRVEALDFMVKPVDYYSFEMVMRKAMRHMAVENHRNIVINDGDGIHVLPCSSITFVEVLDHYLTYHTDRGDLRVKGTIQDAEKNLPQPLFFRCGRSFLVNLEKITSIRQQSIYVGKQQVPVSRSKWKDLITAVNRYWGGAI